MRSQFAASAAMAGAVRLLMVNCEHRAFEVGCGARGQKRYGTRRADIMEVSSTRSRFANLAAGRGWSVYHRTHHNASADSTEGDVDEHPG